MRPIVQPATEAWLPTMDLNHDKQIQSLLCYRYTIGQTSDVKLKFAAPESSRQSCRRAAASPVAQIFNLLYRRIVFGKPSVWAACSRVKLCDTAESNSALQNSLGLRRN